MRQTISVIFVFLVKVSQKLPVRKVLSSYYDICGEMFVRK